MFDLCAIAKRRLRPSGICLPLLILGAAGPVLAQQESGGNTIEIEEIVVTATKRATDLMSTPLAVSALTQEQLTSQGVSDVTDIGDLVPNMQVGASPSDSGVQVTVRGITSNNFTELGDPTVAIHVDGMYSPRPQAGLALLHDVARVEILRGPQGTLFGRNSTSGSINIITSRPDTKKLEGHAELNAGNFARLGARGWFNFPISDHLAFRVSGMMEESDSFIDQEADRFDLAFDPDGDGNFEIPADGVPNTDQRRNRDVTKGEAYFAVNRWAARMAARILLSDAAEWQLTYDHFQDNSPGGLSMKDCEKAEGTFFECDHDQWHARINVPGELDFTINTLRSEFSWDIADGVLMEYRAAWSKQDRFQQWDGDGGAWVDPDHPGYGITRVCCGGFPPLVRDAAAFERLGFDVEVRFPFEDLQLTTRYSAFDSMVHELQFKSAGDGKLQWIAGAFYMEEENSIRFDVEIPFCCGGGIPLAQSFMQPDRGVNTKAVFAQFDYAVTERANVTLGYRHTWDEKYDRGGSNHQTIGYWVNAGAYDPAEQDSFWYESWGLIGINAGWASDPAFHQADVLTPAMGSLAEDFTTRVPGTDNTYQADWAKGTWRAGFDYLVSNDLFAYGYVASGFKAGGFGDKVDICECGQITSFPYDPEEVITYELGLKAEALDGNLRLLANVFFSDYNDMQRTSWVIVGESVNSGNDIGTLLTTNLAEAGIFGAEFEWDWAQPWPGGRLHGWVSWLNAEIEKFEDGDDGLFCFERAYLGLTPCPPQDPTQLRGDNTPRRPTDLAGNKLPWSPQWSLSATVDHTWWLGNGWVIGPSLTWNWQAEMFFNDNNYSEGPFHAGQKAFSHFNANFRIINEAQGWALVLFGYNLSDELMRSWADPGPGYWRSNFFPPRTYGARFSKGF